jgi:hypothetical protein
MVSLKSVIESNISGTFMLEPQSSLAKQSLLIKENEDKQSIDETFAPSSQDDDILKYLELGNVQNSKLEGRTPFTLTRRILKAPNESFGFEISWTKPPQISSVKRHLDSYDQLKRGDFIIFVGEKNVVSAPKEKVLSFFNEQEDVMTLEIFRPKENKKSKDVIDSLAMQNTPVVSYYASSHNKDDYNIMAQDFGDTPKNSRLLKSKPKLCFQSAVGDGVIV